MEDDVSNAAMRAMFGKPTTPTPRTPLDAPLKVRRNRNPGGRLKFADRSPAQQLHKFYRALAGKEASILEEIRWVANNLHRPITKIQPDEPPSAAAIGMLRRYREDEKPFWDNLYPRLTPSKAELEQEDRQRDDGRVLKLLDQLDAEFEAKERARNGNQQQPPLSA